MRPMPRWILLSAAHCVEEHRGTERSVRIRVLVVDGEEGGEAAKARLRRIRVVCKRDRSALCALPSPFRPDAVITRRLPANMKLLIADRYPHL
jgi:hypothetical protein